MLHLQRILHFCLVVFLIATPFLLINQQQCPGLCQASCVGGCCVREITVKVGSNYYNGALCRKTLCKYWRDGQSAVLIACINVRLRRSRNYALLWGLAPLRFVLRSLLCLPFLATSATHHRQEMDEDNGGTLNGPSCHCVYSLTPTNQQRLLFSSLS